jgi:hypothetical protein
MRQREHINIVKALITLKLYTTKCLNDSKEGTQPKRKERKKKVLTW